MRTGCHMSTLDSTEADLQRLVLLGVKRLQEEEDF